MYCKVNVIAKIFVVVAGSQSTHEDNYFHKTLYAIFKQCSTLSQYYICKNLG